LLASAKPRIAAGASVGANVGASAGAGRRGAAVIIEQIKEREVQRVKEREQLEREQAQMVRAIEQQKA